MAVESSWLVGSTYVPVTPITVKGSPFFFPAGYYYLRHPTASKSLIATLDGLLGTAGYAGHTVFVGRDRLVRIVANTDISITWPAAMSTLFGFKNDLPNNSPVNVADGISPLLWSPGKTESPQDSPLGLAGRSVYDTRFGTSPDGVQVADSHHTQVINAFVWRHVATSRFQTANVAGGEYTVFFDTVLRKAGKFFLYRRILEDSSDVPVTWTSGALGPYGYRPTRGSISWDFQRSAGAERFDRFNDVSLDCLITPEWT